MCAHRRRLHSALHNIVVKCLNPHAATYAAYGGRGGNGGRGIVCTTYINVMPSSRCHITGGSGGSGGKGAKNLIGDDNTNRDGKSGQQGIAVDALHKYSE